MKTKMLKTATLVLFFGLILSFVGYKSGFFSSDNESAKTHHPETEKDSLKKIKKDSLKDTTPENKKVEIIPSSKSMIIMDPPPKSKKPNNTKSLKYVIDDRELMMGSSKSAVMFDPNDLKIKEDSSLYDSIWFDTLKK